MSFTNREIWVVLHGLIFGSLYLLAFAGGAAGLWSLRPGLMTEKGVVERMKRLKIGISIMTIISWLTVISGTFLVYIWYREAIPTSARSILLADINKAQWHTFGMEWKEHVSWLTPIFSTAAAWLIYKYDNQLLERKELRHIVFWLYLMSFAAAAIGGLFGAFVSKAAPIL